LTVFFANHYMQGKLIGLSLNSSTDLLGAGATFGSADAAATVAAKLASGAYFRATCFWDKSGASGLAPNVETDGAGRTQDDGAGDRLRADTEGLSVSLNAR
jgi:hypothetical protein